MPQCTRYLPLNALRPGNAYRIQAVLFAKLVDQPSLRHAHTMNAPAHIALAQQLLKHHGLVRSVKSTQSEMQYARRCRRGPVRGGLNRLRNA